MTMKRSIVAIMGVVLAFGLISAGYSAPAAGKPDKVTLQLKWLPQSQFMGYYVAAAKGYYKDEGIEIALLPGGSDIIPEQQVSTGVADIGVTWVSSLLKYQEKGWGFVEVAQIFQKSAMLLVSKSETGIKSAKDLKGKKVGSWFGGNEYELYALIESAGLNKDKDLKMVQQDFTMDQVKKGDVDAASAMTYNEYGLLLESGYTKDKLNVIDMNDAGVAMLEDCLFVSGKWAKKNPELLVRFLRASIKGWADAAKDPEAAGKLVFDVDKSVSLVHQTYMAKEVAKLVTPAGFDAGKIGYIDTAAFKQTADYALKYGLLSKPADTKAAVDDSFWKKATGK
jgi:NitT/TauT family transport system substrate-binding protein